jgi:2-polyprenyl-3-methyl-5-hydroxy-6-metoxy-1,4-benzoquinol methylase
MAGYLRQARKYWHRAKARAKAARARLLRVGSREYRRRVEEEVEHYSAAFAADDKPEDLMEPAPPVWVDLERRVQGLIHRRTGAEVTGHAATVLRRRAGARMLSLGCGAGGVEMVIGREARAAEITCVDVNGSSLGLGKRVAAAEGLNLRFEQADLNLVELEKSAFDVVFCHASLHHVLELERLITQIRGSLRPEGVVVVVDVITRNGYRMWPETRKVARDLFRTLPEQFRLNHTAYRPERKVDREIWESDTRSAGMECLRSEDVLPLLRREFEVVCLVPYFTLCRRFFDTMYGPNYDLAQPLDQAILEWIWELDQEYLRRAELKPETFFGVFRTRSGA